MPPQQQKAGSNAEFDAIKITLTSYHQTQLKIGEQYYDIIEAEITMTPDSPTVNVSVTLKNAPIDHEKTCWLCRSAKGWEKVPLKFVEQSGMSLGNVLCKFTPKDNGRQILADWITTIVERL